MMTLSRDSIKWWVWWYIGWRSCQMHNGRLMEEWLTLVKRWLSASMWRKLNSITPRQYAESWCKLSGAPIGKLNLIQHQPSSTISSSMALAEWIWYMPQMTYFDDFFVYKLNHANLSFPCLSILYDIVHSRHGEKWIALETVLDWLGCEWIIEWVIWTCTSWLCMIEYGLFSCGIYITVVGI